MSIKKSKSVYLEIEYNTSKAKAIEDKKNNPLLPTVKEDSSSCFYTFCCERKQELKGGDLKWFKKY